MIGLDKIPNPTNRVDDETTGYQRQNNNMYIIQTGIDTCEPFDNGAGGYTIPAGGVVEVNGSLFVVSQDISLLPPDNTLGTAYWIAIGDDEETGPYAELVDRPGKWDPKKQGCYLSNGRRTLNWVSEGVIIKRDSDKLIQTEYPSYKKYSYYMRLRKGWYFIQLSSGKGGGDGDNAAGIQGGAGGIASTRKTLSKVIFLEQSKKVFIRVGGDGEAGGDGQSGLTLSPGGGGGGGGSGGGEATSFDIYTTGEFPGGKGGYGGRATAMGNITAGLGGIDGGHGQAGRALAVNYDEFANGGAGGRGAGLTLGGAGGGGGDAEYTGSGSNKHVHPGNNGGNGGNGGHLASLGAAGGRCLIYALGD